MSYSSDTNYLLIEAETIRVADLDKLGNLGDFIGGLAVLVTLVYLALQIRQNTKEVQNATIQRILEQSTAIFGNEYSSGLPTEKILLRVKSGGDLSEEDKGVLRMFALRNLQLFEQVYLQHQEGRISEEIMDAYNNRIQNQFSFPAWHENWELIRPYYTSRFSQYVDKLATEA